MLWFKPDEAELKHKLPEVLVPERAYHLAKAGARCNWKLVAKRLLNLYMSNRDEVHVHCAEEVKQSQFHWNQITLSLWQHTN